MSTYPLGLRPLGLKCVSICYINYSRKLLKVFISLTSGIRTNVSVETMAREEGKALKIEKFDGIDFGYWRMLPLLEKKPDTVKDEEWNLLDRQVLGVIRLTLSRLVVHNVVKKNYKGFDKGFV